MRCFCWDCHRAWCCFWGNCVSSNCCGWVSTLAGCSEPLPSCEVAAVSDVGGNGASVSGDVVDSQMTVEEVEKSGDDSFIDNDVNSLGSTDLRVDCGISNPGPDGQGDL